MNATFKIRVHKLGIIEVFPYFNFAGFQLSDLILIGVNQRGAVRFQYAVKELFYLLVNLLQFRFQMTVTAPIKGRIMKVNVRPGEFVMAGQAEEPPVLMGSDQPLYLRVSIDESDLWRFDPKMPARATLRGHKEIEVPLTFVRTEPYVMPKEQLNNSPDERVDTRVLQAIYRIDADHPPLFIGQEMDVVIEAKAK